MKNKLLDQIIVDLVAEHQGGEVFFDHLDEIIRNNVSVLDAVASMIPSGCTVILSGRFGRIFSNFIRSTILWDWEVISVNGNLRHGEAVDDISYMEFKNKQIVFVDDSFYKGRTRDAIKAAVELNGGTLSHTYVVYDGSKDKDENVTSLYRFFE